MFKISNPRYEVNFLISKNCPALFSIMKFDKDKYNFAIEFQNYFL